MDAAIVSDYGYGVLTPRLIAQVAALQQRQRKALIVDFKDLAAYRQTGITACKPNYREAAKLLDAAAAPTNGRRCQWLTEKGPRILELTGAQIAAVTLDSALSSVDHVLAMDDDTPHRLIELGKPDVFVKGGDYTRDRLPEAELVERLGGTVKILPFLARQSTT